MASALFQCGCSVHSTFAHSIFEGSPSKEGFHGTHENPSRSTTVKNAKVYLHTNPRLLACDVDDEKVIAGMCS